MRNIIEDNKLIAEFMGFTINFGFNKDGVLFHGEHINLDKLKYHDRWDWLMEVVEKIESLDFFFHILGGACFIDSSNSKWIKYLHDIGWLISSTDFLDYEKDIKPTKIESVYIVCVEFIKWYNSHLCSNCGRFDDVVGTHSITICEECALNNTVL